MKKAFTYLLCLICLGGLAQSKIGYVNMQALFDSLPEKIVADNKVQSFSDSLFNTHRALINKYIDLPCGGIGLPKTNPNSAHVIIDSLNTLQDQLLLLINTYSDSVYNTIRKTIITAVDAVAKENGYHYVLDSSNGSTLVLKEDEDDITPLVMQRLKIN
ncbi:MAG: OmpH family outer membrane protein [Sphingobacteriales bacterium JAD_PAG50586_3]|nr:MAG: OmpH family outer membrane protein [Sphingobacteriales bacterium JAD_PAG50586_3]